MQQLLTKYSVDLLRSNLVIQVLVEADDNMAPPHEDLFILMKFNGMSIQIDHSVPYSQWDKLAQEDEDW